MMHVCMYVVILLLSGPRKLKSSKMDNQTWLMCLSRLECMYVCLSVRASRVPVVLAPVFQRGRGRLQLHNDVVEGVHEQRGRYRDGRRAHQHLTTTTQSNHSVRHRRYYHAGLTLLRKLSSSLPSRMMPQSTP